jgi:hypothetical protein
MSHLGGLRIKESWVGWEKNDSRKERRINENNSVDEDVKEEEE